MLSRVSFFDLDERGVFLNDKAQFLRLLMILIRPEENIRHNQRKSEKSFSIFTHFVLTCCVSGYVFHALSQLRNISHIGAISLIHLSDFIIVSNYI